MARFTQLGVAAALQAVESASYDISKDDPYRVGVLLGNEAHSTAESVVLTFLTCAAALTGAEIFVMTKR